MPQRDYMKPLKQAEQLFEEMIGNEFQDNITDLDNDGNSSHDDQVGRYEALDRTVPRDASGMPHTKDGEEGQEEEQLPQEFLS